MLQTLTFPGMTYEALAAQIAQVLQVPASAIEDLETPTDEYGSFVVGNSMYTYDTVRGGGLKPGSVRFFEALQQA